MVVTAGGSGLHTKISLRNRKFPAPMSAYPSLGQMAINSSKNNWPLPMSSTLFSSFQLTTECGMVETTLRSLFDCPRSHQSII